MLNKKAYSTPAVANLGDAVARTLGPIDPVHTESSTKKL